MTETLAPDIELIELPELAHPRLNCDIGNHNNFGSPRCPEEAKWRLAYSCCGTGSLLCPSHKDRFLELCAPQMDDCVTYCPRCGDRHVLRDVLIVEPL